MQEITTETILSESLVGATLSQRFTIKRQLDTGTYGQIFKVSDNLDPQRHLVVKICKETDMLAHEIRVSKKMQKSEVVAYGLFSHQDTLKSFMIMPRYGMNLHQYFETCGKEFSDHTVVAIGTSLLSSLSMLHKTGYVYNDLKPDNILLDYLSKVPRRFTPLNAFQHTSLHLIDFGFAQKYLDNDQVHLPQDQQDYFYGNLFFASRDHMQFFRASRKDDLESLMYLLIYFLNEGNLLGMTMESTMGFKDYKQAVKYTIKVKKQARVKDLCVGKAAKLSPFCEMVLKIGYEQTPKYEKLKKALEEILQ